MANKRLAPGDDPRSVRYDNRTRGDGSTVIRARCYVADRTGRRIELARTGRTRKLARTALDKAVADLGRNTTRHAAMGRTTRLKVIAEEMFTEKDEKVAAEEMSPGTLRTYRGWYGNYIEPDLGEMSVEWVDTYTADQYLKQLRRPAKLGGRGCGYATVRGVRSVLSEIAALAVRYGILDANPIENVADIPGNRNAALKALTASEAVDIWYRLRELAETPAEKARNNRRYRATLCNPMVPDLWLWMLATGDRISQAVAVHWPWINMDTGTARLGPNVIRVPGEGLRLSEHTSKSRAAELDLPEQAITMLLARQQLPNYQLLGPVFPDRFGGLLDPSNVSSKMLRPALIAIGYEHVSSHWCRRTLGSELDAAGLSLTDIAGRLRHADTRTTERHYTRKRALNPRVKAATEAILATEPERRVVGLNRPVS